MLLTRFADFDCADAPLELVELPVPEPEDDELLLEVLACGVCHTELDEIEGRLPPPRLPVVPGHQVVGRVIARGASCRSIELGRRVGAGWIYRSDGTASENLSEQFVATGRDVNGGYAEYMTVPERYAFALPERYDDVSAAPLLCAGAVGYRALMRSGIGDGEVLGLTGFGSSGHLVLQYARRRYPSSRVYVFARDASARRFALELGADWSGDTEDTPPSRCHAIIDTTPAWRPVLAALENLRPGGRLVINAIRKEDRDAGLLAGLRYADHLWREKEIRSIANVTAKDIADSLALASSFDLHLEVEAFPLEAANDALRSLKNGGVRGAKVLAVRTPTAL